MGSAADHNLYIVLDCGENAYFGDGRAKIREMGKKIDFQNVPDLF